MHICCGPCSYYPLKILAAQGIMPVGYFFNPNIHPFREYERRVQALQSVAEEFSLPMLWDEQGYDIEGWFRRIGERREQAMRCPACYRIRLEATARKTVEAGMDTFTTTLLYSRYQRHDVIAETGSELAEQYGVKFYYHDFREGWQQGIDMAVTAGIYRQPYCGCIFSERERYAKREKRLAALLTENSSTGEENQP